MKKMILMAIVFCSFANGMESAQKLYVALSKSNEDKQVYLNDIPQGVCVLSLPFEKLCLVDDVEQGQDSNDIWYCIGNQERFNNLMYIKASKDLVNLQKIQSNNSCDISVFVKSFGTNNIRCMLDNKDQKTCTSKLVAANALALNFLHACRDNKDDCIRGIFSYVDQNQVPSIVKEAAVILSQKGLDNLKQVCACGKLHFRGVKADTQSLLKLFNNAQGNPPQAKTSDGKITVPAATSWQTKFMWLGGGTFAAAIIYLLFIRNK